MDNDVGKRERMKDNTSRGTREGSPMYGELEWMRVKGLGRFGRSFKSIGRELGMDWRTVKKLFYLPEPPRARSRRRSSMLDPYKRIIDYWLEEHPRMRASTIHRKLRVLGYEGSYSTVKRYVRRKKGVLLREATVRFETLPGEQVQVDFSEVKVRYVDGRTEKLNLYLFALGFSRYKDAELSETRRRKALMYMMEQSFQKIEGVPKEVLFDNLKPVAKKARMPHSEGKLAEEWERFAAHYGFSTKLSVVYRAQTKGKVEKPIEPLKRFLESNVYLSRDHLRKELQKFIEVANARVHSTTMERPIDRLEKEKAFLQPLPARGMEMARVERRRVSRDCFVSLDGVKYSVPWAYVKEVVEVRETGQEVQVFTLEGSMIAVHRKLPASMRGRYSHVVREEHYQGLPGTREAFSSLEELNRMGLGPFYVERRSLEEYQEAVR